MEARGARCRDEALKRCHELLDAHIHGHTGETIIAARNNAEQLAVRSAVIRDCNRRVSGLILQLEHIRERSGRREVRIRSHKALLVLLDTAHHVCLLLNALGAVDKGDTALSCERNGQLIAGDRLHDCRDHRNVHLERALLLALAETHQRGLKTYRSRNTLRGTVSRNQKILSECSRRFLKIVRHLLLLLSSSQLRLAAHVGTKCFGNANRSVRL